MRAAKPFWLLTMPYHQHGFKIFSAAFDLDTIESLRQAVERVCTRYRDGDELCVSNSVSIKDLTARFPERNPGVDIEAFSTEPFILGNLARLDGAFGQFLSLQPLWNMAAQALDLPVDEVVYHFSNITRKPPGIGPAIAWHRDYPNKYICTERADFVRLLVPLHDMSPINGGIGIVPSSHHIEDEEARRTNDMRNSGATAVYPPLGAGDALVLHPKLIHGGGPNRSACARDVLIVQFGKKQARLLCSSDEEYMSLWGREEIQKAVHCRQRRVAKNAGKMARNRFDNCNSMR
ncbi:MAG: phytanoyl-CoA dioxygenase family protein [Gammaproteobacteria bacterium]|nr:phytanoyl-CoA dioxygenase family protein [Gammaproteobacteria bacterium]